MMAVNQFIANTPNKKIPFLCPKIALILTQHYQVFFWSNYCYVILVVSSWWVWKCLISFWALTNKELPFKPPPPTLPSASDSGVNLTSGQMGFCLLNNKRPVRVFVWEETPLNGYVGIDHTWSYAAESLLTVLVCRTVLEKWKGGKGDEYSVHQGKSRSTNFHLVFL